MSELDPCWALLPDELLEALEVFGYRDLCDTGLMRFEAPNLVVTTSAGGSGMVILGVKANNS